MGDNLDQATTLLLLTTKLCLITEHKYGGRVQLKDIGYRVGDNLDQATTLLLLTTKLCLITEHKYGGRLSLWFVPSHALIN